MSSETQLSREETVRKILLKSTHPSTVFILAVSETEVVVEIYNQLYNIK